MDLKGKRVLVTGADGFIGSHLVEALLDAGANVRAFVYYNSFGSWGWIDTLPDTKKAALDIVAGDIRDSHHVSNAMEDCEVVFHLAALIAIPFSYTAPDSYVDTNIKGTLNVLHAARDHGVSKVLITSTSEVYGTARYIPIDESHPMQGQSPYSASKIGADRLAESFHKSFGLPVVIVRPFNTYGPRQSARAVLPTIITQILSGAKEVQLGRLDPVRDFVFVKDTVAAMISIAESDKTVGEEINIATGVGVSIGDAAHLVSEILGGGTTIVSDSSRGRPEGSEVERLIGNGDKLFSLTGWKPAVPLREGLTETIEWYRKPENLARYKADIYNI
jgi:NAD dependent epimerase/dehydratase